MSTLVKDLSELLGEGVDSTDATQALKIPKKKPKKGKGTPSVVQLQAAQSKLKAAPGYKDALESYVRTGKLPSSKVEELDEDKHSILQHLALAAQAAGVNLDDESSFKSFYDELRDAIRDKSRLRSVMRTWTAGKARATVKVLKAATV